MKRSVIEVGMAFRIAQAAATESQRSEDEVGMAFRIAQTAATEMKRSVSLFVHIGCHPSLYYFRNFLGVFFSGKVRLTLLKNDLLYDRIDFLLLTCI